MTSQLNVDTIVDKAGSGGTNVKIGNTSTYVGEGGSGTQNTVQGLTKVWCSWNDSTATQDSFNVSSIGDEATGVTMVNFSNNLGNDDYALAGAARQVSGGGDAFMRLSSTRETSRQRLLCCTENGTDYDGETQTILFSGDLA